MQSQAELNNSSGSEEEIQEQIVSTTTSSTPLNGTGKCAWDNMSEPDTLKVGHYVFLKCGHNGNLLNEEKKVYLQHLARAGIVT